MKILYYSGHPHINMAAPSGPGTHIREVVQALRGSGCQVITLIVGGETLASESKAIAFKRHRWKKLIPKWIWQSLKDWRLLGVDAAGAAQLKAMIELHKPDFVYERAAYLMCGASRVCASIGLPHMIEINAPYPEEKIAMEGWSVFQRRSKRIEQEWIVNAKAVFTVSSAMFDYLSACPPLPSNNIHVVPNAVGPNWLSEKISKVQVSTGDAKEVVVGFVGSIFAYHGVDLLIQSASVLDRQKKWKCKYLIVGDGAILPQLKQLAKDLGVDDVIEFTGNVPHHSVQDQINRMDICVMPRSNWYGSPVKIFEYGAMGKCIVAPNVIPVTDVMDDGRDGLLIEPNEMALTQALEQLLENSNYRQEMAMRFQKKVFEHYTWPKVADKILSCYK